MLPSRSQIKRRVGTVHFCPSQPGKSDDCRYQRAVLALRNVVKVYLRDLRDLFDESPLDGWLKKGLWRNASDVSVHMSQAIRGVLAWRHGGIYADLDVVVRRPMAKLRNSVGKEDNSSATLNTAVMVLRKRHPVLKLMMEDMARMYSPVSWSHASASSLLRVLHEHYRCANRESAEFAPSEERSCVPHSAEAKGNWNQGASDEDAVTLHPLEAFNPVHFSEWDHYWYRNFANQTLRAVNSSYVLHLWAAERANFTGPPEEGSAYAHEARINCPRAYGVYGG
ncbi:lactosylceramide 4-alpha-galactosyltransferase-like [Haemaphysalis longicornis]